MCLGMGLEIVGRVSNDMAAISRAMKVLYAVALGCKRLLFAVVFRRRFLFAFVLRVWAYFSARVLGLGL